MELFDLVHIISTYSYVGIFFLVFLTSGIFFLTPGDSLLFTAGILAANGLLSIELVILVVLISTFLGALTGFYIGGHLKKLYKFAFFRKFIKPKHIKKTRKFFDVHGHWTIVFSRFVAVVRTFTPIVAGMGHMSFKRFVKYSVYGSLLWSLLVPLIGYFLGGRVPGIASYVPLLVFWIIVVSLLPVILKMARARYAKMRKKKN